MYRCIELVCVYGPAWSLYRCIELSMRMDLVLCGSCYCVCMSVVRSASEMCMCVVRS